MATSSLVLLALLVPKINAVITYYDVTALQRHVFSNYSKDVLPLQDQETPLDLNMTIIPKALGDYNDVSGIMTITLGIRLEWRDELLTWDPEIHGNISAMKIKISKIWVPSLSVLNSGNDIFTLDFGNTLYTDVANDGSVGMMVAKVLMFRCEASVKYYPMDDHICQMEFSFKENNNTILARGGLDSSKLVSSSQWDVVSASYKEHFIHYPTMSVKLTLSRRSGFLFLGILMPLILLSFLNLLVFVLPIESGERVSFSITVLLSIAVFFTVTSEKMPPNGNEVSLLCIYLFILQIYSCVITFVNIVIVKMYHHQKPVMIDAISQCFRSKKIQCTHDNIDGEKREDGEKPTEKAEYGQADHDIPQNLEFSRSADSACLFFFCLFNVLLMIVYLVKLIWKI